MLAVILVAPSAVCAQSSARSRARQTPAKSKTSQSTAEFDKSVKLADEARLAGRLSEAFDLYAKALRIRAEWPSGVGNAGPV